MYWYDSSWKDTSPILYIKNTLGINKNSTKISARAELGRYTVKIYYNSTLKYLGRLHYKNVNVRLIVGSECTYTCICLHNKLAI
jgi:hypothetical protein